MHCCFIRVKIRRISGIFQTVVDFLFVCSASYNISIFINVSRKVLWFIERFLCFIDQGKGKITVSLGKQCLQIML